MDILSSINKKDQMAADYGADSRLCADMCALVHKVLAKYPDDGLKNELEAWEKFFSENGEDAYGFAVLRDGSIRVIERYLSNTTAGN
jgi:hypothetical protein